MTQALCFASKMSWNFGRLDSLLQATLLLTLSEQGRARDFYYDLVDKVDATGERLDAFSFGVLDALVRAHLAGLHALPLLLYLLKLDGCGPGPATVEAAQRALAAGRSLHLSRYVDLGRRTAVRALEGGAPCPGQYAELLLSELTRD